MTDLRGTPKGIVYWAALGACYGAAAALGGALLRQDFNWLTILAWAGGGAVIGLVVGFLRGRERD